MKKSKKQTLKDDIEAYKTLYNNAQRLIDLKETEIKLLKSRQIYIPVVLCALLLLSLIAFELIKK